MSRTAAAAWAFVFVATACNTADHRASPSAAVTPSASAGSASSSAQSAVTGAVPVNVAPEMFTGKWTGTYRVEARRIELPPAQGGLPEWKVDDPKSAVGAGTLSVVIDAANAAVGTASGPLGAEDLRGAFDGDSFSARLISPATDPKGYAGTLFGKKDGDHFSGALDAGSADGHHARTGTFRLSRNP